MSNINNRGGIIMNMSKQKDQIGYDLNEKDIDGVLRFLKYVDPVNATPERAISFLAFLKSNIRESSSANLHNDQTKHYEEFKKKNNL